MAQPVRRRRRPTGIAAEHAARTAEALRVAADAEAEDDEQPNPVAAEELADVEDEGQREPECRISRVDPEDGKLKFLTVAPPGMVNARYLQKKYGGGEYITVTYASLKGGRFGFVKGTRKSYNIDLSVPFKGNAPVEAARTRDGDDDGDMKLLRQNQIIEMMKDQAESRNSTTLMMMQMMKMMADSSATNMQAMTAMMSSMTNRTPDTGMATVLAALVQSLANKKDPAEIAAQLVALTKSSPSIDGIGSLDTILDLADRISRRQNGEDITLTGVLKESLPAIIDVGGRLVDKMGSGNRPAAAPTARIPGPRAPVAAVTDTRAIPAPAAEPAEVVPAVPTDEWTPLEPEVGKLAEFASNDSEPDDVAGLVILFAPSERKAQLREMLRHDDMGTRMLARFPALAPFPGWLDDFLMALRVRMGLVEDAEDTGTETEDAPPPATEEKAE